MIVEDDLIIGELLEAVFADAGYVSEVVTSPGLAQGTYDLIVADYLAPTYVPGLAWPFLDCLRRLGGGAPIIGCTAHQSALTDDPRALGVAAVVTKPFDVEALLGTVRHLLDESRVDEHSPIGN
ncbi:MAG: hypothetical protein HY332_17580 [Chloroflexi bacterium]|nr:hypothetical protein [Chloroflexota bacterium]